MSLCCLLDWLNTGLNLSACLVLAATVACQFSALARFYVKSFVMYASLVAVSALSIPYGLMNIQNPHKTRLIVAWLIRPVSALLGVTWHHEFVTPLEPGKAYVMVANHQSALDVIGMLNVWDVIGPTTTTAKKELMYAGPFGLVLWLCGTIFVDRMSSAEGRKAINEAGEMARKSGTSIWVFPEGTRNRKRDGSMLPFKKGAFHVAVNGRLSIVPVVFSEYDFMNPKAKRFESGDANIKFLEPISVDDYAKDGATSVDDLTKATFDAMQNELSRNAEGKKAK